MMRTATLLKKSLVRPSCRLFSEALAPWEEREARVTKMRSELVLAEEDQVESYVLNVLKNYFRTSYKDGLSLESEFRDHGLDSLDAIELAVVLEDELGYIIEAETIPKFTKVRHLVNYIRHMEAYKREFFVLPQVGAQQSDSDWDKMMPKGEQLKNKLYGYTKE